MGYIHDFFISMRMMRMLCGIVSKNECIFNHIYTEITIHRSEKAHTLQDSLCA